MEKDLTFPKQKTKYLEGRSSSLSYTCTATKISKDILPYLIAVGNPGFPVSVNAIGLKRAAVGGIGARTYQNLVTDNLFSSDPLCEELGFKPVCNFYETLPHIVESIEGQAWLKERE